MMGLLLTALYALCFLLLASGAWQISRVLLLRERSSVGRKAIRALAEKKRREREALWNTPIVRRACAFLAARIHLNELSREALERRLRRAELDITPEEYTARQYLCVVPGALAALLCVLSRFYLGLIAAALATAYLLLRLKESVDGKAQRSTEELRLELPRCVRAVCQLLTGNRDVAAAFTSYRKVAGEALGKELDVLLLAIQTGSVPSALVQFQHRVGTDEAYRLCGALLEMERGVDQTATLQNLADDMSQQTRLNIQKELARRPRRMRRTFIPAALLCGAMMIYALVVFLMSELHALL